MVEGRGIVAIMGRFQASLVSSHLGSPGAATGTENGPLYPPGACLGMPVLFVLRIRRAGQDMLRKGLVSHIIIVQERHCRRSPFGRAGHGLEMAPPRGRFHLVWRTEIA